MRVSASMASGNEGCGLCPEKQALSESKEVAFAGEVNARTIQP